MADKRYFKCPKCGVVSSGDDWIESTNKKYCKSAKLDPRKNLANSHVYVCPQCYRESIGAEIKKVGAHITKQRRFPSFLISNCINSDDIKKEVKRQMVVEISKGIFDEIEGLIQEKEECGTICYSIEIDVLNKQEFLNLKGDNNA